MTSETPAARMRGYLQLVATGPELSKSLDEAQAEDAINLILNQEVDEVQSAIFLIALRMKRETDAENAGALSALVAATGTIVVDAPQVMALADPFNGFVRGLSALPFLPAVLSACGLPTYCHGVRQAGPKYGITPLQVLVAAGRRVDLSVTEGGACLDASDVGWCYLDQSSYNPALHALVPLRDQMVKRTCLSTLEVVLKPLSGAIATHLLTGFVHKAYPPVYAALARQAGFNTAALVRGVEGGCIPSLSQLSRYFGYRDGQETLLHKLTPSEVGIHQKARMIPLIDGEEAVLANSGFHAQSTLQSVIARNAEQGLEALSGKQGAMCDALIYGAAIALSHSGIAESLDSGAMLAREVLSDGRAMQRFVSAP